MSKIKDGPFTLREITVDWLETHGYDGLYSEDGDCACQLSDLMPCGEPGVGCSAGYKAPCGDDCYLGGDCEFHIQSEKSDRAVGDVGTCDTLD